MHFVGLSIKGYRLPSPLQILFFLGHGFSYWTLSLKSLFSFFNFYYCTLQVNKSEGTLCRRADSYQGRFVPGKIYDWDNSKEDASHWYSTSLWDLARIPSTFSCLLSFGEKSRDNQSIIWSPDSCVYLKPSYWLSSPLWDNQSIIWSSESCGYF